MDGEGYERTKNHSAGSGKSRALFGLGDGMNRLSLIHQAKVYLAQCRATQHREWKITLLNWACKVTREAMQPKQMEQMELL